MTTQQKKDELLIISLRSQERYLDALMKIEKALTAGNPCAETVYEISRVVLDCRDWCTDNTRRWDDAFDAVASS